MAQKENTTYNKIYDKTPAILTIKDKKTFEKWLQVFQPWIETGGATDVILATYNLTNKDLGRLFVLRFCKHSAEFIMTIPILGYGEDPTDTTGMHAAEQSLAKQIQIAAQELGHEEKFENLLLSSTKPKERAVPPTSVNLKKEPTEEENIAIAQQLREAAKAEAASKQSKDLGSAKKTSPAGKPESSSSASQTKKFAAPLISPPQEHEISDDLLQFMGINMTEKKKLATAPPIWMNVVTWARERSDFMAPRVAIWNYIAKCLHESPYAHILNQTEVYDVRGLYSKLKEILHKSSIIGLSSLTADFFQTMLNPGTKDPVCYFNELTEKADVIAEMAQQVDRDAKEDLTGGFRIPKFLITVALIHTLTMRKEFNNFMRRLLEEGNLNRVQLTPEKLIEEAQRYQENLRLINPRMGASSQRIDTSEAYEAHQAEDSKGKKKDACHRNHDGKYCDESKCRFKHYKPSVEKPPKYSPDPNLCLGCGKEKSECPSRETCSAKDSVCDHCKKKGHLTDCCLKKPQAQETPQADDTSTVSRGGRGGKRGGRGGSLRGRGGKRGGGKGNQAVRFEQEDSQGDGQDPEDQYDSEEETYSLFHAQALYGNHSTVSRPKNASNGKRIGEASHPGPPEAVVGKCKHCGRDATNKCAPCGTPYCSRNCQAMHRKTHREECQRLSLMRKCVRCGVRTGGWCDQCEDTFIEFKRGFPNDTACGRALCSKCETNFGFCNVCLPPKPSGESSVNEPSTPSSEESNELLKKACASNLMMGSMSQSSNLSGPSGIRARASPTNDSKSDSGGTHSSSPSKPLTVSNEEISNRPSTMKPDTIRGGVLHNSTEAVAKSLEEEDNEQLTFQFKSQRMPKLDDGQIPPIASGYRDYQPNSKQDPERS